MDKTLTDNSGGSFTKTDEKKNQWNKFLKTTIQGGNLVDQHVTQKADDNIHT